MGRELQPIEGSDELFDPPLPRIEVGNALLTEIEYDGLLEIEGLMNGQSNTRIPVFKLYLKSTHRSFIERPGSGKLTRRLHKHCRGEERIAKERKNIRGSAFSSTPERLLRLSTILELEDDTVDSTEERLIENYLATLPK